MTGYSNRLKGVSYLLKIARREVIRTIEGFQNQENEDVTE